MTSHSKTGNRGFLTSSVWTRETQNKPPQKRQASGRQVCLWTSYRSQSLLQWLCWTDWHTPPIFTQIKPLWWPYDWHLIKACMFLVIPTFQKDFPYSHTRGFAASKLLPAVHVRVKCECVLWWTVYFSADDGWDGLRHHLGACACLNMYNWIFPPRSLAC